MDLLYSFDNFQNDTYFEIYSFFICLLFKTFENIWIKNFVEKDFLDLGQRATKQQILT